MARDETLAADGRSSRPGLKPRGAAMHDAIVQASIDLFLVKGFEETTIDEIAAVVGVSRRTIFRHFAVKEDIVLAWITVNEPDLTGELQDDASLRRPLRGACEVVLRRVVQKEILQDVSLPVARLVHRTPALRARSYEKYVEWENAITAMMVRRGVAPAVARMAGAFALAGLRAASEAWAASDGKRPLADHLRELYAVMTA